jgi:hypothetical protein
MNIYRIWLEEIPATSTENEIKAGWLCPCLPGVPQADALYCRSSNDKHAMLFTKHQALMQAAHLFGFGYKFKIYPSITL